MIDPDTKAEALQRYAENTETVQTICDDLGISTNILQRWARAAGLPARPRGFDPELKRFAVQEYAAGFKSTKQLERDYGVDRFTLRKWAKAAGVPMRSRGRRTLAKVYTCTHSYDPACTACVRRGTVELAA